MKPAFGFREIFSSNATGTGIRSDEDYDLIPNTGYCYVLRAYVGFDMREKSPPSKIACGQTGKTPTTSFITPSQVKRGRGRLE